MEQSAKKIFGPERDEDSEQFSTLDNKELCHSN
jgi:hypothetical protein